jgi:predicted nucleic acid-binding protein
VIVVTDTSPLNYLVLVESVDVLPRLFSDVYTAPEVLRELRHERAHAAVQAWASSPPGWLRVLAPSTRLADTARLDPGEADAISLAKQLTAAVLIDERKGRRVAERLGLVTVGTLAVIELAAERKLLELRPVLDALQRTSCRIPEGFVEAALARAAARGA